MKDSMIGGLFLIIVGGLQSLKTDWFINIQIWVQKKLMGADYIPSAKTYKIIRFFGMIILIMGLLMLFL